VCNCDWGFCSTSLCRQRLDLRNRGLHRQKRILPLRGAIISDAELTGNLSEIDLIDGFNDQWQAASIRFRLFVRVLVIKP
jgi:hypothetical protein